VGGGDVRCISVRPVCVCVSLHVQFRECTHECLCMSVCVCLYQRQKFLAVFEPTALFKGLETHTET
jgi:hypothetical protein